MLFLTVLFMVATLVPTTTNAIIITNHMKGGLGPRESTPIHNQLIMTLTRKNPVYKLSSLFGQELESVVGKDQCVLVWSGKTMKQLALTLDCPLLDNKDHHTTEQKAPLPLLENTVAYLKANYYDIEHLEYLQRTKKPFVWWESDYHKVDEIMKESFANRRAQRAAKQSGSRTKPQGIIHGAYTQYPVV
jgi:hypothetical protein